jgi:hypothetical protein
MAYDMTEIEKRLQLAASYRTLLDMKFFDKSSDVNEMIELELKEFIHGKLETVLGVRTAENPAVFFSGTEALALKALARKLLDKEAEPEPEPAPVVMVPKAAPKPKVRRQPKVAAPVVQAPQVKDTEISPSPEAVLAAEPSTAPNIVVENGRTYEMIEVGGKPFAKDITKQVKGSSTKPMPSKAQFEQMMYTSAMQELAAMNQNPLINAAAQASINKE